ncbi:23S rRNA (guanosine(2251)-2'-O)-methyltransferase RlmB [Vagococcus humatus]|uniref:23S rRNA (Guanosine(2251)-2'-O)-methyltransferase RlmB n=1 Tax=Vagococcus humatus TaxID=1889241 RepID=A0A3R9YJ40_9ENTE|nr:23S rRNA (guanosine(2251)-2'-O)-methyltransferase RlmB [Vagococcus humatus]RST88924.1 23S rRNA (guanosine(2251)-2'-O)-methyltransferase RlmB [Vagococcus humatus]
MKKPQQRYRGKKEKKQGLKLAHSAEFKEETDELIEVVYGRHAAIEAIQKRRGNKLFLLQELEAKKAEELKELAQENQIPVKWVPRQKLDQLTDGAVHQGIVLTVTPYEYLTVTDLIQESLAKTEAPVLLILDSIEDPHNFGSMLRTADATGIDGVIIPKHRSVGVTSTVTKTSTGAVEYIPIARTTNLTQAVEQLKEAGFWIFGTDMAGTDYREWNVAGPIALIIGNEGKGVSPKLKKQVDEMITIPMTGHVQSLNAGVAAGLLMYEVYRKRQPISKGKA